MIRLAVIGTGQMGANHARVASRTSGIELAAVVDVDAEKRHALATAFHTLEFATVSELLQGTKLDAAVVATPTKFHHAVVEELLAAGVHVLVEKPIALTVEEGEDLEQKAKSAKLVLQVGHVERFNPAVRELLRIVDHPIHLDIVRSGPFSARVLDNVVVDLMIHDLDLARKIAGSEVSKMRSITQATRSDSADLAVALLTFENGVTASVTASRIGQQKIRQISVTQPDSVVVADLIRQDVNIHRMQQVEFLSGEGARYRQSGVVEIPFIENRGEPLMEELRSFAESITTGSEPAVSAKDGTVALGLAHRVFLGK
jgi:UDP-N-acetylglucosamine 3-dehydrogenase